MSVYRRRILDDQLDEVFHQLPAVAIEGPKGVGKTQTALQRASSVIWLDDASERTLLDVDPDRLARLAAPILLDEWQRYPPSYDLVRRNVDRRPEGGRFLLTGSATPRGQSTHSGAGRIAKLRMRPLSLFERALTTPTVSMAELLSETATSVGGTSPITISDYVDQILASGFPGIANLSGRARVLQLDGYIERVVDRDFPELGHRVRRPSTLKAWLTAYAAATATTAAYNAVLDAATAGDVDKPAKTTTIAYRDTLTSLWLLDPVPGWTPSNNRLTRLTEAPKHHLADPALAARLLRVNADQLLGNARPMQYRGEGPLLGALFESLVTLSVRVYAQACDAAVHHLRVQNGTHEIDLIIEGPDGRLLAIEIKLSGMVEDKDVRHLRWFADELGDAVADLAVVTTGREAYRRRDGIAVIPAALLGP